MDGTADSPRTHLFAPLTVREVTLRNRIAVSPMCQYSCIDGLATDWHLVHLGSRAVGGAGLVIVEATAVEARGRISPQDLGIWQDAHIAPLARIAAFMRAQGAVPGIQLAHAGRKASTYRPWSGNGVVPLAEGGWEDVLAPSAIPFAGHYPQPRAMTAGECDAVRVAFVAAAQRALAAGFLYLELHAAHGYLLHTFLSPLANRRVDDYGGSRENRMRFVLEIAGAVRMVWPAGYPLAVRLSATDWMAGGWAIEDSVALSQALRERGVDLVVASSGGVSPDQRITLGPGYQVPFAERIRHDAAMPTMAVGLITDPHQAESILAEGKADIIALARQFLRDPYWPLRAAAALDVDLAWPDQYARAKPAPEVLAGQR